MKNLIYGSIHFGVLTYLLKNSKRGMWKKGTAGKNHADGCSFFECPTGEPWAVYDVKPVQQKECDKGRISNELQGEPSLNFFFSSQGTVYISIKNQANMHN